LSFLNGWEIHLTTFIITIFILVYFTIMNHSPKESVYSYWQQVMQDELQELEKTHM
jgi:hypothetical protein